MGMPIILDLRDGDAGQLAERVFDWLREVDERFSTYKPGSEISRLNRGELERRDCHPDVRAVLARCDELREATDGYFDARYASLERGRPFRARQGLVGRPCRRAARRSRRAQLFAQRGRRHPHARAQPCLSAAGASGSSTRSHGPDRRDRRGERPRDRNLGRLRPGRPHTRSPHAQAADGSGLVTIAGAGAGNRGRLRDRRIRNGRARARLHPGDGPLRGFHDPHDGTVCATPGSRRLCRRPDVWETQATQSERAACGRGS